MSIYLLLPLVQALFSLILIGIVLKNHYQNSSNRLFSIFLFGLALWGLFIFGMRSSPDIEHAYFWERWLIPLCPLLPVVFYHFSIRYTGTRANQWLLNILYIFCFLFSFLALTDLVVKGMQIKPYGYAPITGPLAPFWFLSTYAIYMAALINFIRAFRTSYYPEQRNRYAYICIGIIITMFGGIFDILPVFGLPLYPGLIIGTLTFILITTIAIVKYNLLDIHVVLRKGVAYVFTSSLIAVPFIGVFLLVTNVFVEDGFPLWAYFALLLVLAVGMPPLWQVVQRRVDKWFYRDRYNYLKALETFSQETQSITDSTKLESTMVNLIAGALQASTVCLLQPVSHSGNFAVVYPASVNEPTANIQLKRRSPLVKWLERSKSMLSYADIDFIPQLQSVAYKEKEALKQIGAELIVPLKARSGQLLGVLILSKKFSEQPYTVEDKRLIYTVSNQMITNLENVRLYNASRQEVAERKLTEQALKESERRYRLLAENAKDVIWTVDMNMRPTYMSPSVTCLLGYTVEETMTKPMEAVYTPASFVTAMKVLAEELAIENMEQKDLSRSRTLELELNRKDGSIVPVEAKFTFIREPDGRPLEILAIARDITERKQAEEREKELQQELLLSSRLASIGELAAGVAHEINNPLTGVLGFSQRLLRKTSDEDTKKDLEIIYNEAQRTARIVENLLTFARRRHPKKEYSNINDILQKTLELRDYELQTSNIEVVTDLAPSLPTVIVDFYQIQEAFLNIILNAEQFMVEANGGGKLTIKTLEISGKVRISFTDDGPGIAAEHLNRVFDPFFTTRAERGGTGLGLSVCHGIVTEHGGKIYTKSKPGQGTTFFVELPLTTRSRA